MKPKLRYVLCDVGSYILCPELLRAKARGVGGGIDCGNHKHQLRACCCGTSCVPAAAGLLRVAGTAGVARREDPWTELLL